ncbi:MAG: T9SS type A sorting domain-containing protein, partial [Saprospiraceae bacterium]
EPAALTGTVSVTGISGLGALDGTATANPLGGTGSYSYLWNTGLTTQTISNLGAGDYCVTITDANNCTTSACETINDINCGNYNLTESSTDVICNGADDGTATVTATAGQMPYNYLWSNGATTAMITNLSAQSYGVTVTDANNCVLTTSVTIVEPAVLTGTVSVTGISGLGALDGSATANPLGGTGSYSYLWNTGLTTQTIANLGAGDYCVTITDANNCTTSACETINDVSCGNYNISLVTTNISCNGENDGSIAATAEAGQSPYTYLWSNGATNAIVDNLSAMDYSVTITDANNCVLTESTSIIEPLVVSVSVTTTNETTNGANDGTATAMGIGGTGTLSYAWDNTMMGTNLNNLAPGTYTVTVTDENDCSAIAFGSVGGANVDCSTFTTTVMPGMISCFGAADGTAMALPSNGTAPYAFLWSNNQTTQQAINLGAGSYSVTVTDSNNCTSETDVLLTEPSALSLTVDHTNETVTGANDGTATTSLSGGVGGYTYLWSNSQTTTAINNLAPAIYTVTVADANGCSTQGTVTVLAAVPVDCQDLAIDAVISDVSCFGAADGSLEIIPTGGLAPYSFVWALGSTNTMLTNLSPGAYPILVRDANNCEVEQTFTINEPDVLAANISGFDGDCGAQGSAVAVCNGGTPPYSYQWSNGATTSSITDLDAGDYSVVITDANDCIATASTDIVNNANVLEIDLAETPVSCFGVENGAIDLTVTSGTPPFSFDWNNGATTEDLTDLAEGDYIVVISDAEDCSLATTVTINAPDLLTIGVSTTPSLSGTDGTALATVSGGTPPFVLSWSNGDSGTYIENLAAGTYSVEITDANGCVKTQSFEVSSTVTSVGDIDNLQFLEIIPNPVVDVLNITALFTKDLAVEVMIYDVLGRTLYHQQLQDKSINLSIDVTDYAQGAYLVVLKTADGFLVEKIVKQQ